MSKGRKFAFCLNEEHHCFFHTMFMAWSISLTRAFFRKQNKSKQNTYTFLNRALERKFLGGKE